MAGEWTVDDIAHDLRRRRDDGVRCALLIGAGCSYQAGIPLARGFVEMIQAQFPREYARAVEKTYPHCMAQLSSRDRHKLICDSIDKAKINWAHISIAQLMRAGFVDRVLTTNFDPLVMRACALLNLFPAVYDMAVVRKGFLADFVRDLAVFHLHGQRDGFVQLHEKEDVEALAETLAPLFDDTARNRSWIVLGYSGANDPVFRALADRPEFPNRLFWVGYRDEQPSAEVRAALIDAGKDAHWIAGFDPDTFLVQLAARLGCFPPGFFAKPFSHLMEGFATLAGFRLPGQDEELDWAKRARGWIEEAVRRYEEIAPAVAGGAPPAPSVAPPAAAGSAQPERGGDLLGDPFKPAQPERGGIVVESGRAPAGAPPPAPPPAAEPLFPEPAEDPVAVAWAAMMAGEHERVIALADVAGAAGVDIAEPLAWSLAATAKTLAEQAQAAPESERAELMAAARQRAGRADALRPGLGGAALADVGGDR